MSEGRHTEGESGGRGLWALFAAVLVLGAGAAQWTSDRGEARERESARNERQTRVDDALKDVETVLGALAGGEGAGETRAGAALRLDRARAVLVETRLHAWDRATVFAIGDAVRGLEWQIGELDETGRGENAHARDAAAMERLNDGVRTHLERTRREAKTHEEIRTLARSAERMAMTIVAMAALAAAGLLAPTVRARGASRR